MQNREFTKLKAGMVRTALLVVGLLGLALGAVQSTRAQEVAGGTNSQPGQVATAYLDYQDVSFSFDTWSLPVSQRPSAFKKEPAFGGAKVIRGMLLFAGGASNEMAFAWNRSAGKLYLDLNRNLDLTDDAGGVFSCQGGPQDFYQTFANIRLPFKTAAGIRPTCVDLSFYDYGWLNCSAAMRSFWQGKVTLQGQEWQVGLLGTPDDQRSSLETGNLLLRPWREHNKFFSLRSGSLEAFPFKQKLFIGNQAYQLQCTNEAQGDTAKVRVQFTEQKPSLGELKIAGGFVRRMTLEGGPYMVVIDQPQTTVKVPAGRYREAKVCLRKGDVEAYLDQRTQSAVGGITVNEKGPAVLTAGGPLTNSVSITRHGRMLSLNYRLVGVGGTYQLVNQDRSHPPEFTIYQGDKKVKSGKFEFG
jgi:hypothetical protein